MKLFTEIQVARHILPRFIMQIRGLEPFCLKRGPLSPQRG